MMSDNKHWKTLKDWIKWGVRRAKWEIFATTVILPYMGGLFVNLLTSAPEGQRWPYGVALASLALIHGIFVLMQILPDASYPLQCVADAAEAEDKLRSMQLVIDRKSHACKMLREAIETLNLQTCQLKPADEWALCRAVHPVIERVTCNIHTALGVATNEFTIELYCREGAVSHAKPCGVNDVRQEYFYSPMQMDPCRPFALGHRAPHVWGIRRGVPGICRVSDDPNLFQENGKLCEKIYFRVFCTVPVYRVCSTEVIGVLVLTSMQEEALAGDALEVLQFVASLISQLIDSHNRCVLEWKQRFSQEAYRTIS